MNREEAARRYLQADMAAHALPGERAYDPAREAHEDTKRKLEHRHPDVKRHATVGVDQDFDERLNRNEREHQAYMRKQAGLTNTQIAAQRKELRDSDYGRVSPSELYQAANPSRDQDAPHTSRGRRPGTRRRRRSFSSAGGGVGRRVNSSIVAQPVHEASAIAWEIVIAAFALSLLYLILTGTEEKKGVLTSILDGITGGFVRLADPTNNLFKAAPKTVTSANVRKLAEEAPPLKAGLGTTPTKIAASRSPVLFGGLPSSPFASATPTIP